jgi:hypothetical protein
MSEENTPDRNHFNKAKPATNYGEPGWGDGVTTAETAEGAEKLTIKAANVDSKVGFSGSVRRRVRGGILGKILDIIGGKDPDIFDAYGRVRHKFTDSKWQAWDDRIRASKAFDWRQHSGSDPQKPGKTANTPKAPKK